jgi:Myb-like DNA-binding domain
MDYTTPFNQQTWYTYMEGTSSGYDPVLVSDGFISSQQHSNLSASEMTKVAWPNLYTEYSSQSSTSGKEKSSSEDEPATEFTSFLDEDEDWDLSGLSFLRDLDGRVAASCGTLNDGLKRTSTEQLQRARLSRQLHDAYAASSEFVQAGSGQMILPHTKGKSCFCSSLEVTVSGSPCHMSPKKVALRRIWMSCELRSFPNGRKIRALAELAEISSKTARKWLTEFVRLGLTSGRQVGQPVEQPVEQPLQATCVMRHGRPTSPFQPRNIERKYICIDCHHTFKRKDDWIKHTSLNYVQSYWQCLDCEYRCAAKRSDKLKQHFKVKHPRKKLAVDAAIHYRQADGSFEKQCGFCGYICKSFSNFTGHVSRHFEDSTADPPYDMRIWRDPWTTDEAEHPDHSEDDDDDDDEDPADSNQEDGQDEDGDSQDFDTGNEQTDDNQDSRPSDGSGSDYFSNYPAADGFWDGYTSFGQWVNWRSSQEHKQHRHLTSEWAQHDRQNMDSSKELSTDPRDKPWYMTSQTPQGKSGGRVFPPFGIPGSNSGLRQIRLDREPTVAPHDTQSNDVKARRDSWTSDEDERLLSLLDMFGAKNWIRIAEYMPKKSSKQCRQRYHQNLKLDALPDNVVRLSGGLCSGDMRLPHNNFQNVCTVRLDSTVIDSDCRSLVLRRANGDRYGHIIAGSSGTGAAYVNPATQAFEDLEQLLGGAAELGKLALTITLAGSYVAATLRLKSDIRLYRPEYYERRKQLLGMKARTPIHRHGESALSTWKTSFAALEPQSAMAARLFSLLAFTNFDDIFPTLLGRLTSEYNLAEDTTEGSNRRWQSYLLPDSPMDQYAVSLPTHDGLPSLRQHDTLSSPIVAEISGPDNPSVGAQSYIKRDVSADSGAAVDDCEKEDLDSDDKPWNKDSDRLIRTQAFQTLHRRMGAMPMLGWSVGDLLQFARFAKTVFDSFRSAPQNLRQSLQRFQDVANRLEELADILQKSGWPSYDRAPNLRADLEDAKRFFDRVASLSTTTMTSASRLFDATRPRLGRGGSRLHRIDENLEDHLEKMSAFKQHVIL